MKRQYLNDLGQEMPTVTTVLAQLNKPQLVAWAARLAQKGINWENVRNEASDIGTLTHTMAENFIKNQPCDFSSHPCFPKANRAYQAFQEWNRVNKVRYLGAEISLVHRGKKFGGTVDIVAEVNDKITLIDLKTSSSLNEEYNYQVTAYKFLLENGDLTDAGLVRTFPVYQIEQAIILRVDKNSGIYEEMEIHDFETYQKIFFLLLDLWHLREET